MKKEFGDGIGYVIVMALFFVIADWNYVKPRVVTFLVEHGLAR